MVSGHHSFLHSITTLEKLLPGPLACHIFFHSITTLEKLPQDIYFNTASFAKISFAISCHHLYLFVNISFYHPWKL